MSSFPLSIATRPNTSDTGRGYEGGSARRPMPPGLFARPVVNHQRLAVQNLVPFFKMYQRLHQPEPSLTMRRVPVVDHAGFARIFFDAQQLLRRFHSLVELTLETICRN